MRVTSAIKNEAEDISNEFDGIHGSGCGASGDSDSVFDEGAGEV